jgi:hypothetical protein
MVRAILAAALGALLAGPGQAGEIGFASRPVDVPAGSRLVIGLTNSCDAPADYRVRVRTDDGTLVLRRTGTMPAGGEASLTYAPDEAARGVVVSVRLGCADGEPKPWLSYVVTSRSAGAAGKPRLAPLRAPLGLVGRGQDGSGR